MEYLIAAKKHLGDKDLRSDIVSQGILELGDWAYAYCGGLRRIALPASVKKLGRDVFLECSALEQLYYYSDKAFDPKLLPADPDDPVHWCARLNALAVRFFADPLEVLIPDGGQNMSDESADTDGGQNMSDESADTDGGQNMSEEPADADGGCSQKSVLQEKGERLKNWDRACLLFMERPDDQGFRPFLAGGEEDYSENEDQLDVYRRTRQLVRAKLLLTRLLAKRIAGLDMPEKLWEQYLQLFASCPAVADLLNETDSYYSEAAEICLSAGLLAPLRLSELFDRLKPDRVEMRAALIAVNDGGMISLLGI